MNVAITGLNDIATSTSSFFFLLFLAEIDIQ